MYCIICGQRIHRTAFVNWSCQYWSFLNIFFNRFSQVEKGGVTPYCLYCDSLTVIYHISSNRRRTLAAPLITRIEVSVPPKSAAPLQQASQQLMQHFSEKLSNFNSSKTKIHINSYIHLNNETIVDIMMFSFAVFFFGFEVFYVSISLLKRTKTKFWNLIWCISLTFK